MIAGLLLLAALIALAAGLVRVWRIAEPRRESIDLSHVDPDRARRLLGVLDGPHR